MPGDITELLFVPDPVVRDASDTAAGDTRARVGVIHLADNGVLGSDRGRNRGDRSTDRSVSMLPADRLQSRRRLGQYQLRVGREKIRGQVELPVINPGGVAVHQITQRRPVVCAERHVGRDSRWAQADSSSLACSRSAIGGMASTTRSAPWAASRSARSESILLTE